jgi:hypothetical protein
LSAKSGTPRRSDCSSLHRHAGAHQLSWGLLGIQIVHRFIVTLGLAS